MDTISTGVDGVPTANIVGGRASMSDDGRYVVFSSVRGMRVVEGEACAYGSCIFLRDRVTGRTTVVSSRSDGTPVADDNTMIWYDISGDGRLVAFTSTSRRLVPLAGRHPLSMLYLKHLRTGRLDAVPTPNGGNRGEPLEITAYQIVKHGRYVVTSGTFPGEDQVLTHVYDRVEDTWEQIGDPTVSLRYEAVSPQGARYVVVSDIATGTDVQVADRVTGTVMTLPHGPAPADFYLGQLHFSGNGTLLFVDWFDYDETGLRTYSIYYRTRDLAVMGRVALASRVTVKAVDFTGRYLAVSFGARSFGTRWGQVGVFDRETEELTLVSRSPQGEPANDDASPVGISLDGTQVLFNTPAGNIAPESGDQAVPDRNFPEDYEDLFVATLTR